MPAFEEVVHVQPWSGGGPEDDEAGGQLPEGGDAVEVGPEGGEVIQRRGVIGDLPDAVGEAEGPIVVRREGGGVRLGSGAEGGDKGDGEAAERRRRERGEELRVEAVEVGLVEEDACGESGRGGGRGAEGGEDGG